MPFIKFKFEPDHEEEFVKIFTFGRSKDHYTPKKETKSYIDDDVQDKKHAEGLGRKFILDWYKEFSYTSNPFKDEILNPLSELISGYEKERDKLNLFIINNNKFGVIHAKEGQGKTTVLKWLHEQLNKYPDKILLFYLNDKVFSEDTGLLKEIQNKTLTWWDRFFRKLDKTTDYDKNVKALRRKLRDKKLVILGDDITHISKHNLLLLNKLYNNIQFQLILTTSSEGKNYMHKMFNIPDKLNLHLAGLSHAETKEMVEKRIKYFNGSGLEPFNDKLLNHICEKSDKNPRKILDLCQKYAIEIAVRQQRRKTKKQAETKTEKENPKAPDIDLEAAPKKEEYKIEVIDHSADSVMIKDHEHHAKNYKIKSK